MEQDTGYAGNDIRSVSGVASPAACCAACTGEPACRAWTLVGTKCWLKSSDAGRKSVAGRVSGAPWSWSCTTEQDTDYAGNDLKTVNNVTVAADCCAACSGEAACSVWSWHPSHAKCFMKSSDAGRHTFPGGVSGARAGGPPPPPPPAPLTFNPWCDGIACVPGVPPPHAFDLTDEELLSGDDQYTIDPTAGGVSDW